jgi:membrane-associated protease RseP (regulator of RpoE activity)
MHAAPLHAALLGFLLLVPAGSQRTVSDSADEDKVIQVTDRKVLVDGEEIVSLGDDEDGPMVLRVGGRRGYLGVRLVGITDDLRKHYGAPEDAGILVGGLEDDSPAAKAGVQVGDVITQIDGDRVDSSGDLGRALRDKKAGDKVRLQVIRDRRAQDLTVTVDERSGRSFDFRGSRHAPRAWTRQFGDMEHWRPMLLDNLEELPKLRDQLDAIEKRLSELEKRLPAR